MSRHSAPVGSLRDDEPVLVTHAVLFAVAQLGLFLVGHTHLVTAAQWDGLTSTVVPLVTTAIVAGSATLTRRYVAPAAKVAQRIEDEVSAQLATAGAPVDLPDVSEAFSAAAKIADEIVTAATPPTVNAGVGSAD